MRDRMKVGPDGMDQGWDREGHEYGADACAPWVALLPDAAEGLLSDPEMTALDRHIAGCVRCAAELADAKRGAAWLALLKGHTPEPPADLLLNILAKTSGNPVWAPEAEVTAGLSPVSAPLPSAEWYVPRSQPVGGFAALHGRLARWFGTGDGFFPSLQPRLAMTSAMAFLSICLTANLLGSSAHALRPESLRPAGLQRTVVNKSASLIRSFEGIRTVYRVESRVNEWLTASTPEDTTPMSPGR